MNAEEKMTAGQVIEYMKAFPEDAVLGVIAIDTHQEEKVCFLERDVIFIADSDTPAMTVNIDRAKTEDITSEVIRSSEEGEEESGNSE
jgi:hypothetical protein